MPAPLPAPDVALLTGLIFLAAALYSSVGHGGASGYLAAMALFGLAPTVMKPTALVLNILVAGIGTVQFARAGVHSWRTLWPFVLGSAPLAFLGGAVRLPGHWYRPTVGVVLLFAAWRLAASARAVPQAREKRPPIIPSVGVGAGIGLLSGLTGTGGGIFLSPLLLLTRWAETREASATAAAFILVNSVAGLAGNLASVGHLPAALPIWATAAGLGGLLGANLGSRRLPVPALRYLLAVTLVVAALKLILAKG